MTESDEISYSATIAMPVRLAAAMMAAASKSKVRPVSTARQVAPARAMASMVARPMTGTSKRMSCAGLATLTTVRARLSVEAESLRRRIEGAGTLDGGVGALHGFDGDAGPRRDDDGLAEVEGGEAARDGASVGNVLAFVFAGGALGEDAGPGEQRLEILSGGDQLDALVGEDLGHRSQQLVGRARTQVEKQLGETPVWTDA